MGLWTKLHALTILPTFVVLGILAFFIAKWLKNKDEKIKNIPFMIISVFILIIEIIKQIVSFEDGEYNLYSLPFHYCSLFLYLLPLHAFYKGKYKKHIEAATFICCASLFLFMLVVPTVIYGEGAISNFMKSYIDTHTVVFHNVVCFYFMLMIALKTHEFETKRDLLVSSISLSIYCIIATILSYTLKVNFHNLRECNLGAVEQIRLSLVNSIGTMGQVIYVFVIFIGTTLIAFISYFLTKLCIMLVKKIKSRIVK